MNLQETFEIARKIDVYGSLLAPKQRQMLESYVNFNASLSEIAENFGISRQAVLDIIKQGSNKLDKLEENLKFLKKIDEAKQKIFGMSKDLTKKQLTSIIKIIENLED